MSLTEEGGRVLARCEKAARAANDELFAPLTAQERTRLLDMVRRVAGLDTDG
ncbi:hypothetical protein ABZ387_33395 [Streptomyces flaveolus]|uniref:hypothetical protein n=1 Tax=Streptomyces flaveolus TaxID=67297 RepID=UPI003406CCE5